MEEIRATITLTEIICVPLLMFLTAFAIFQAHTIKIKLLKTLDYTKALEELTGRQTRTTVEQSKTIAKLNALLEKRQPKKI